MKFIQPLIVTQNKILKILQIKNIRSPLNTQCSEFGVLKPEGLHHFNIQCNVHKFCHSPHVLHVAINEIFFLKEQIHEKGSPSYQNKNKII